MLINIKFIPEWLEKIATYHNVPVYDADQFLTDQDKVVLQQAQQFLVRTLGFFDYMTHFKTDVSQLDKIGSAEGDYLTSALGPNYGREKTLPDINEVIGHLAFTAVPQSNCLCVCYCSKEKVSRKELLRNILIECSKLVPETDLYTSKLLQQYLVTQGEVTPEASMENALTDWWSHATGTVRAINSLNKGRTFFIGKMENKPLNLPASVIDDIKSIKSNRISLTLGGKDASDQHGFLAWFLSHNKAHMTSGIAKEIKHDIEEIEKLFKQRTEYAKKLDSMLLPFWEIADKYSAQETEPLEKSDESRLLSIYKSLPAKPVTETTSFIIPGNRKSPEYLEKDKLAKQRFVVELSKDDLLTLIELASKTIHLPDPYGSSDEIGEYNLSVEENSAFKQLNSQLKKDWKGPLDPYNDIPDLGKYYRAVLLLIRAGLAYWGIKTSYEFFDTSKG